MKESRLKESETVNLEMGPRETIDHIAAAVSELENDMYLSRQDVADVIDPALKDRLKALSLDHPLYGAEVFVSGVPLTAAAETDENDETRMVPRTITPANLIDEEYSLRGVYYGYTVQTAYSLEEERTLNVIVHTLQVDDKISYYDELSNYVTITPMGFVTTEASSIEPVYPMNDHSLVDLEDCSVIEAFDETLLNESFSVERKIRTLGQIANKYFKSEPDKRDLHIQCASYLNGTGIARNVQVLGTDYMTVDREEYLAGDKAPTALSKLDKGVKITSPVFDALTGYTRNGSKVAFLQPPQLFLGGNTDEKWLAMPAATISTAEFI